MNKYVLLVITNLVLLACILIQIHTISNYRATALGFKGVAETWENMFYERRDAAKDYQEALKVWQHMFYQCKGWE